MRMPILITSLIGCLVLNFDYGLAAEIHQQVTAVERSETETVTTETHVEETVETTVVHTSWQNYFITGYAHWHSNDMKSTELKNQVDLCFSESLDGYTYWERISKNMQYIEFLAAATGYEGDVNDIIRVKEHCVQVAASKPRLMALAFKSISKHMENSSEKLVVSRLAQEKYHIGQKEVEVKQDWKQFAIQNFMNFKSNEEKSEELVNKVTTVLSYDTQYFDKFINKKIYAQYLARATGYTGDIKQCEELKEYLRITGQEKPRLVAVALKNLAKNLKNPKVELKIPHLATERYGIQQTTVTKIDWKNHLLNEYLEYKSTQQYKEQDQRLRVSSMLNYEADGGTILDLILKRDQYRNFFAQSIGYDYSESSFNENDFREYVKNTSQLYPTLVSLSFRSICRNLKSNDKLEISPSAIRIIEEKLGKKVSTETFISTRTIKTSTTTTKTRKWTEYAVQTFANLKTTEDKSDSIKTKLQQLITATESEETYLQKVLHKTKYAKYIARSTGYSGDYRNVETLRQHLEKAIQEQPRLVACSIKYIAKNQQDSHSELRISNVAQTKYHIPVKTTTRVEWANYAIQNFANFKTEEDKSHFLKARLNKLIGLQAEESTYLVKILENKKYAKYLAKSTGFTGDYVDTESLKTHIMTTIEQQPRLVACSIKYIAKNQDDANSSLRISHLAERRLKEFKQNNRVVWADYAINNFANFKTEEDKSHLIRARLLKLIDLKAEHSTYLTKVLKKKKYAKYIAISTGYTGDYKSTEELRQHVLKVIQEQPRLFACSIKYIAQNQADCSSTLKISNVAKTRYNIIEKAKKKIKKITGSSGKSGDSSSSSSSSSSSESDSSVSSDSSGSKDGSVKTKISKQSRKVLSEIANEQSSSYSESSLSSSSFAVSEAVSESA